MKLSIVTTLYYSSPYIQPFYERTCAACQVIPAELEFVFVNDGSPDDSLDVAVRLSERDPRVKVIDLSRNFGHHKAAMTGLMHATGDLVFLIDVDLEEEPELVAQFYQEMQKHPRADVVYGVQDTRKGGWFERWSGGLYYRLFNALSSHKIPENLLMARLMTRRYVDALLLHRESELDIGGLWTITGFEQVPVTVHKHSKPTTTYTLQRKIALTIRSVTAFSNRPLLYIAATGVVILGLSFLYFLYTMYVYLFVGKPPDGFTTIVLSIWFLGGLTIFSLGVIAIYLSVIFTETKQRPYTIIRQIYQSEKLDVH
ncbi:MAG: glycosyltransferase family 2 protein [Anaerolineales bacterium]|nr:glycosyltransferase family 2 protein [Anaerolineales bacterium]MCX7755897.1 glycosyltransferase family 2 protein [Anaerolineales bacterium]MDW8277939.1 glycosyltransferase family 2 protein [Anaerolineales bacterium]